MLSRIFWVVVAAVAVGLAVTAPRMPTAPTYSPPPGAIPWIEGEEAQLFRPCPPNGGYSPPLFGLPLQRQYGVLNAQRGEEYRKYLKVSVRIRNGGINGSGTICYYDRMKKRAYVISCGHLFRGGERTVEILCFYKNDTKLPQLASFRADVLAYDPQEDLSFMAFTPDWEIDRYYPIAPVDYPVEAGKTYYSCGCDQAKEVACYLMRMEGLNGRNLELTQDSPQHGRSGGGLLTDDGYLLGVCWGSTDPYNGTGIGMFVPPHRIHQVAQARNLGWLLSVPKSFDHPARQLRIVDRDRPQGQYPPDYIPIP